MSESVIKTDVALVGAGIMSATLGALLRQVQQMGLRKIEDALGMMVETDMILRSSSRPPEMALVERTLIRLAEMVRRN